jgi:hypothetical protein
MRTRRGTQSVNIEHGEGDTLLAHPYDLLCNTTSDREYRRSIEYDDFWLASRAFASSRFHDSHFVIVIYQIYRLCTFSLDVPRNALPLHPLKLILALQCN